MRLSLLLITLAITGCVSATLTDLDGRAVDPLSPPAGRCSVLIFTTVDCPIANSYAAEIERMNQEFRQRGADFYLVHVDRELTADQARKHAADFNLHATLLIDRDRKLVDFTGAKATPEGAVILPGGKVIYHGRIDDRYVDYGLQKNAPGKRELRDAIEAALAGRAPAVAHAPALGCTIPR